MSTLKGLNRVSAAPAAVCLYPVSESQGLCLVLLDIGNVLLNDHILRVYGSLVESIPPVPPQGTTQRSPHRLLDDRLESWILQLWFAPQMLGGLKLRRLKEPRRYRVTGVPQAQERL